MSIHLFQSNIIYSKERYDSQYQKLSEGQQINHIQSYHHQELSLFSQSDLLEHIKFNYAAKSQTERNMLFLSRNL